jgi:hypothetical protein
MCFLCMLGQMHQDADYNYDQSGVGYHVGNRPRIKWDHPDGALLYFRNGEIHWLTPWESIRCWLKWDDAGSLERKHRPNLATGRDAVR